MSFLTVGHENSEAVRIYYEDHGSGAPVVLVHGYLLDGHSWEKQEAALLDAGYRVITYDRRGFGNSSRPSVGYDYDTLSADLNVLLTELDLHDVTLVGFSAGTGEVTRYLAAYGSGRVRAAALLAPLPPFLLRTGDNPDGIDRSVFEEFMAEISADRPAAAKTFLDKFYNIDLLGGSHVSDQAWQNSFHVAIRASARATLGCAAAWLDQERPPRRHRRRAERDHLDPRRPGQPGPPRFHRRWGALAPARAPAVPCAFPRPSRLPRPRAPSAVMLRIPGHRLAPQDGKRTNTGKEPAK